MLMKSSRSEFLVLRRLRTHVRQWGNEGAPRLFMLHGWMDVSASFQFVVDCLARDWHVIAPDWRGFGLTERAASGSSIPLRSPTARTIVTMKPAINTVMSIDTPSPCGLRRERQ